MLCSCCGHQNRAIAHYCGMCGMRLNSTPATALLPLSVGEEIGPGGRYRILAPLGQGGFGSAFRAFDSALGRDCVVKQLRLNPAWDLQERRQAMDALAHEVHLLVRLNSPGHPNIPEIYEYLAERCALVMKFIDGQSLQVLLKRRVEPLPEAQALRYARDVCAALVYMHSRPQPVLHRDIKPANLLIDHDGRLWLIDFGLSRSLHDAGFPGGLQGSSGGTVGYTPPEQWQGRPVPRSDVYALGATLYELLTNQRPPAQPGAPPSPLERQPGLLPETDLLVRRAVAHDPADRPNATELLAALDAARDALDLPPPPAPAAIPVVDDLLGREAELAHLADQLSRERAVALTGMAGMGKTALAATLAAAAPQRIWQSLRSGDNGETLLWFLSGALARLGRSDLWRQLQHRRRRDSAPPPFEALADYLARLCDGLDLLIVLDDLHLAEHDDRVAALVSRLLDAARRGGPRLLITSRSMPAWLISIGEHALGGLSFDAAAALVRRQGLRLDPATLDSLFAATEGGPQLLLLATEALRRSGDQSAQVERLIRSGDITRFLLQEIDGHLNDEEREVMEALAVLLDLGGDSDAVASLLDGRGYRRSLQLLAARRLLRVDEQSVGRIYRQPPMVQRFYYGGLGATRCRMLHRRAAAYYEQSGNGIPHAARHWLAAGDHQRAAAFLSADISALISAGYAQVLDGLLAQVDQHRCDPPTRVALALAQGEVALVLRKYSVGEAGFQQALRLLDVWEDRPETARLRAQACRGMGRLLEHEAPQQALVWLRRGLAALDGRDEREAALLHYRIGSALSALGEYEPALSELQASLQQLPADAAALRANVLVNIGVVHCARSNPAEGLACYREAQVTYERLHDLWGLIKVRQNIAIEVEIGGEWAAADQEYRSALKLAEQIGDVQSRVGLTLSLGILSAHRGELAEAEALLAAAATAARDHHLNEYRIAALSSLAEAYLRGEQAEAAAAALAEGAALADAGESSYQMPEILRLSAQLALAQGDVAVALGYAQQAIELAQELEQVIDEGAAWRVYGIASLAAGAVAQAREGFERSLAFLADLDPYEAARTQAALGSCLTLLADPQAEAQLEAARHTFHILGAHHDLALMNAPIRSEYENTGDAS